jgi:hypothetical protein
MARAAPSGVRRHRHVSRPTGLAAPTATITAAAIRSTWTSSATAEGRPGTWRSTAEHPAAGWSGTGRGMTLGQFWVKLARYLP